MTNKNESDADFMENLAKQARAAGLAPQGPTADRHGSGVNSAMIMNPPPVGRSRSLEDMLALDEPAANPLALPSASGALTDPAAGAAVVPERSGRVIEQIPVHLVDDSPYQPRITYDESAIQALGALLEADGQNDPVIARAMPDGRYQLISGHRRIRAARMLGWSTIDARIIAADEFITKTRTFFSNEGHKSLTEYERAVMYAAAIKEAIVVDQASLAKRVGLSPGRISQIMGLLSLPREFTNLLDARPDLFDSKVGAEIRKLLKEFPQGADVILEGAEKFMDDAQFTERDLREFVQRKLKQKPRSTTKPQLIQNSSGKNVFSVTVTEKRIVIDIKEAIDTEKLGKKTLAQLREFIESNAVTAKK